ncbi:hypothetical protein MIR68_010002 [Amoeboaphelidium protococcarum]|nr:hypothetical protein MIR68_010002 [Amoeboaphelidium protococcarum]
MVVVFCYRIADVTKLQRSVLVPASQYYHALEDKDTQMSNFMNGTTNVMICSNSVGLGVDIPNIRAVYHYGPSYTLIDYVQETGRAGRDGRPCEAILLDVGKARHVNDPVMTVYCRDLATCRRELMHREIDGEDLMTCNRLGIVSCDNCALQGRQGRPDWQHINWRERLRIEQFGDEDMAKFKFYLFVNLYELAYALGLDLALEVSLKFLVLTVSSYSYICAKAILKPQDSVQWLLCGPDCLLSALYEEVWKVRIAGIKRRYE